MFQVHHILVSNSLPIILHSVNMELEPNRGQGIHYFFGYIIFMNQTSKEGDNCYVYTYTYGDILLYWFTCFSFLLWKRINIDILFT